MKDNTAYFGGKLFLLSDADPESGYGFINFHEVYIERVMYNNPATIVFWSDGTKTVSKCTGNDIYNKETGLAICVMKKMLGVSETYNIFADWLPEDGSSDYGVSVRLRDVRKNHKKLEKEFNQIYR